MNRALQAHCASGHQHLRRPPPHGLRAPPPAAHRQRLTDSVQRGRDTHPPTTTPCDALQPSRAQCASPADTNCRMRSSRTLLALPHPRPSRPSRNGPPGGPLCETSRCEHARRRTRPALASAAPTPISHGIQPLFFLVGHGLRTADYSFASCQALSCPVRFLLLLAKLICLRAGTATESATAAATGQIECGGKRRICNHSAQQTLQPRHPSCGGPAVVVVVQTAALSSALPPTIGLGDQ